MCRLLRILRSSKHLRLIIESLGKSLPNLGWILFFLVVVFYVFGLIGTHAFGEVFKDWFGNLGRSMYTLFQVRNTTLHYTTPHYTTLHHTTPHHTHRNTKQPPLRL